MYFVGKHVLHYNNTNSMTVNNPPVLKPKFELGYKDAKHIPSIVKYTHNWELLIYTFPRLITYIETCSVQA